MTVQKLDGTNNGLLRHDGNGRMGGGRVEPPKDPVIELLTLDEFVQRPSISSFVSGLIPSESIVVVFGPPKGGKTFSVCDLTMHAAHGMDWHGCKVTRNLRVAYCVGEGINGFRARLKAWLKYHQKTTERGEFRIISQGMSLPIYAERLVKRLRSFAPDIVVADTLNVYFGSGDENSTRDMTRFCDAVRYVRDQLGCSVVVIHHTGHADSGRERGSIVLRATADVLIQVAKDETVGDLVGLQVIAARDMESMESAIPLKLMPYETGWLDDENEPIVTCIVQAGMQSVTLPGRGGRPLGSTQSVVMTAARELAQAKTPDTAGFVVLAKLDIAKLAKTRGVSKTAISNCWKSLSRRGLLRLIEPASISIRRQP